MLSCRRWSGESCAEAYEGYDCGWVRLVVELYNTWKRSGCKKVALSCPDKDTFLSIADEAEKAGLTYYAVVIVCFVDSPIV